MGNVYGLRISIFLSNSINPDLTLSRFLDRILFHVGNQVSIGNIQFLGFCVEIVISIEGGCLVGESNVRTSKLIANSKSNRIYIIYHKD